MMADNWRPRCENGGSVTVRLTLIAPDGARREWVETFGLPCPVVTIDLSDRKPRILRGEHTASPEWAG